MTTKTYTLRQHTAAVATKPAKAPSTAAQTASAIRKELKAAFPHTTFSVKRGSGYDSVRVSWVDGPTTAQVNEITAKYRIGHFDGMIDLYEYSNRRDDIPQVRYVFPDRDYTFPVLQAVVTHENQKFDWDLKVTISEYSGNAFITRDNEVHTGAGWNSHDVMRVIQDISLVCPHCQTDTMPYDNFCPDCGSSLTKEEAAA